MRQIAKVAAGSMLTVLLMGAVTESQAGIDRRQRRQQGRIGQGVASGQVTPGEFLKLERGQARIDRNQIRARADGEFTARERVRINRQLNRQSRQIYREKHDNQTRR